MARILPIPHVWLLSRLRLSANGKPVECLWCAPEGTTFRIRHIGELRVEPSMLERIVENFAPDRDPPRVPINVNHQGDSGDLQQARAIGWVVDMAVVRTDERVSLTFTPHWSDEAKEVIEAGGFRYVSVGLDLDFVDPETGESRGAKVREISTTNTPAIPELAPIELTAPLDLESRARMAALNAVGPEGEPDLLDRVQGICEAFFAAFPDTDGCAWNIVAVWLESRQMVVEECVRQVSEEGDKAERRTWKLGFEVDDRWTPTFAPREEWTQVRQEFVPVKAAAAPKTKLQKVAAAVPVATKERKMDLEQKLRQALKLADDADVVAAVESLMGHCAEMTKELETLKGKMGEMEAAAKAAEAKAAEAEKGLSAKSDQVVQLSGRADQADAKAVQLSARVEALEQEKREAAAAKAISEAIKAGKLTPAEVDGDKPMRKMALSDPATFAAILADRPAMKLTGAVSQDEEPAGEAKPEEFWALVRAKRAGTQLTMAQAQDLVLAERPEFQRLVDAANARLIRA